MRSPRVSALVAALVLLLTGAGSGSCSDDGAPPPAPLEDTGGQDAPLTDDAPELDGGDVATADDPDAPDIPGDAPDVVEDALPVTYDLNLTVMTANIGTTPGLPHDRGEDDGTGDGYTKAHAVIADELYENSLSWNVAEAALVSYLGDVRPDIAVFQEMYFDRWCEDIEVDPTLDFVCRDYTPERPLQIERLLGPDYQYACADGQDDNCLAVKRSVGRILSCPEDEVCLGGLVGMGPANGCSRGARIGRAEVELADGRRLVVVNVHGTSGITDEDVACRVAQFEQVFLDRQDGSGRPAADGAHNLVMGDLNTDPYLLGGAEPSAMTWNTYVGEGKPFRFISPNGPGEPRSYSVVNIDHVVSDTFHRTAPCVLPGVTDDAPVFDGVYWDHVPVICRVGW